MKPETANFLKVLYVMFALPFNVVVLIRSKDMRYLIGITVIFGFIALWLWEWRRRLMYRTEFLHLASRIPQLTGKEREEAHRRLLELAKPNIIPVHEIAAAFDEMNKREMRYLTDKQRKIIDNLRAGKEIFYSSENPDIQFLVKHGWLITTENEGEYIVNVERISR